MRITQHAGAEEYAIPDVVRLAAQVVFPVSALPESIVFHLDAIVSHGRVSVWRALQIHVDKLAQISPDNLVRVDKDDALELERKEHVEEENLVAPDGALLLALGAQPRWPCIRHELVVEAVLVRQVRDEGLERR